MSLITHPFLGLPVGDPTAPPLNEKNLPSTEEIAAASRSLILSASGWRKVFAQHRPNDQFAPWDLNQSPENSLSPALSPSDRVIVAGMALAFSSYIKELAKHGAQPARGPTVLLGIDTRPTGPAIADIFARVLLAEGCEVRYLFIVAAPEIMAYAAQTTSLPADSEFHADGFAYISASHNPPGHNGLKFGTSGGVLSGEEIAPLIAALKAFLANPEAARIALDVLERADARALAACYGNVARWKRYSHSAYMLFAHRVFTDEVELDAQERALGAVAHACEASPFGVVGELNGSARTQSIDADWLGALGVSVELLNADPRAFAHRIVPENNSLADCADALARAHREDPAFLLGYVPDCDGDRGNLVYYSERLKGAVPLEAQQVFALVCLSELAYLRWKGEARPVAVVVNDATSMRIEAIAEAFGARVFRAETGEANVVNLAQRLRGEGWVVRILGEGSNGGNITHPSRVRDPLSTLGSMIRLLRLHDISTGASCFSLWLKALGVEDRYRPDYTLDDIIDSLPGWATTSAFESYAALKIAAQDKVALKREYQHVFLERWPRLSADLERRYGIRSWRAFASVGSGEFETSDDFSASKNGGLRIVFYDASGAAAAFFWMRASGTEPVFRVGVDIRGGASADEAWLRSLHTELVLKADLLAAQAQNIVG